VGHHEIAGDRQHEDRDIAPPRWPRRSLGYNDTSTLSGGELNARYDNINADDYKWNAEQFNLRGAELKRDGLQLGYHNHSIDLRVFGRRSRCEAAADALRGQGGKGARHRDLRENGPSGLR
jgi:hypothetical protein